ncbi:MAG: hypothetical protein M1161_00215 [Candidatus Thermoplasmatota archaeon]|jgi:hypothetical protein|nr:hypothetical protein [Candidatus Thermoplasmatota archaeon]
MNYESSHTKVADDGIIKSKIFKILLRGPCTRRDLRWELQKFGFKISSKAVDYHLRRGKKGLINEGVVKEERRLLSLLFNEDSLPKIIRLLIVDPKTETRFNEDVSYAYWRALVFLDRDIEMKDYESYKRASENYENKQIENIETAVSTILKAYEYDIFLDGVLEAKDDLKGDNLNYDYLSPASGSFNKLRFRYEEKSVRKFMTDLLDPAIAGTSGSMSIYDTGPKSELLHKVYDVSKTLWYLEHTHLEIVLEKVKEKAEKFHKRSYQTVGLKERKKKYLYAGGPEVLR